MKTNFLIFGQLPLGYTLRTNMDLFNTNQSSKGKLINTLSESDIKGSPFLNEEFIKGSIFAVQKIQYDEVPLCDNIYNNNLEFKTPDDEIQALATPDLVERAVLRDMQLVFAPYLYANKNERGFYIILKEGRMSLYAKPEIDFKTATEPAAYKEPELPKFIKKADEYYLKTGTGLAQKISGNKDLILNYSKYQDKFEAYISKNKIKLNNPENLKELVRYNNSMN